MRIPAQQHQGQVSASGGMYDNTVSSYNDFRDLDRQYLQTL